MKKYKIIIFIMPLFLIFPNCRTMMINQTAKTLEKQQKESSFYTGFGFAYDPFRSYSIKFQFGYQQRFGLSENIEFQFFLLHDFDLAPEIHFSNDLRIAPKFRVYHNEKYNLSLLPCIGFYNSQNSFIYTNYLGPYTGIIFISSHHFKKKRNYAIYYGFGIELGENFLFIYNYEPRLNYQNRFNNMLFDLSLGTSFGIELLNRNVVTRHEFNFTTSFDFERDFMYNKVGVQHVCLSITYGFSIGGLYSPKKLNKEQ